MSKSFCLIIDSLTGGGAEKSTLNLARLLLSHGCEVHIILLNKVISFDISGLEKFIHVINDCNSHFRLVRVLKRVFCLRKKIKGIGIKFDIVIANLHSSSSISRFALLDNLYFCIHSSEFINFKKNKSFFDNVNNFILRNLVYRNGRLICVSNTVKKHITKSKIPFKSIKVIYNPILIDEIIANAGAFSPPFENYVINVARFTQVKRHDILLKAFKKSAIDKKLVLMGEFQEEYSNIVNLINQLELQNQVILLNSQLNPYPFIKGADALIVSSDYESFSLVTVEALILKVPVISTNCYGPEEILSKNYNSWISPVGDIDSLSSNIQRVCSSPYKIYKSDYEKFDFKHSISQYINLIKKN